VEALEMLPQRMWRIGESAVREGVGREQVGELVVIRRPRDAVAQRDRGGAGQRQTADDEWGEAIDPSRACGGGQVASPGSRAADFYPAAAAS
jgi:hypothetical protein